MEQLNYEPPLDVQPLPGAGTAARARRRGRGPAVRVASSSRTSPLLDRLGDDVAEIVDEFQAAGDGGGPAVHGVRDAGHGVLERVGDPRRGRRGRGQLDQQASATPCTRTAPTRRSAAPHLRSEAEQLLAEHPGLKQIQDGDWVMVWPADRAAGTIDRRQLTGRERARVHGAP